MIIISVILKDDSKAISVQSILKFSSPDIAKHFTKVFLNPQGQLCLRLNRPIAFTESLIQVAREGPKYGHAHQSMVDDNSRSEKSILLLNDTFVLKNVLKNMDDSTGGCGSEGGITVSEGRSLLLVGVLANLLRARGFKVHQHQWSMPHQLSSFVSQLRFL